MLLKHVLLLLEPLTKSNYKAILEELQNPEEEEARQEAVKLVAELLLGSPEAQKKITELIKQGFNRRPLTA